MVRALHADTLAEIVKEELYIFHLIEFVFDGGTDRFTTAHQDLVHNSNTYTASAQLIGFGDVNETDRLEISTMNFSVTAVAQGLLSTALSSDTINRKIILYRGLLNPTTFAIINDPIVIYTGLVTSFSLQENPDGETTLTWKTGSVLADFSRTAGRRTNHQDQEAYLSIRGLSGPDKGFEYSHVNNFDLRWGRV